MGARNRLGRSLAQTQRTMGRLINRRRTPAGMGKAPAETGQAWGGDGIGYIGSASKGSAAMQRI